MILNGDTEQIDQNFKSWTVISDDSSKINISLGFEKPVLVSSGYSPDLLFVQLFLSDYTDHNG